MGARVWDFFQAYPSDQPSHKAVLDRIQERMRRADVLSDQQREGLAQEREAVARRAELRRRMLVELLPHLVRVGQVVGEERPDLAGKFRLPSPSAPLRVFRDSTRSMLNLATADRDLFVTKGLSPALLDDLTATFGEFEKATEFAHEGKRDHVGASADLKQVTAEIVRLVSQLDAFNRYRFGKNAELLAAWRSARRVVGPFVSGTEVPKGQEDGPVPPEGGAARTT
jgi:hypothetical protein